MRAIIQTRSRAQFLRLAALLLVIVLGLALRRFGYAADLPFVVVKYGGSALWGAMVYLLVSLIAARSRRAVIAVTALLIAISVELFRLYHAPWLDAFRLTTAGALLLGRMDIFVLEYAGLCHRHRRSLRLRSRPSVKRPRRSFAPHEADATARLRARPWPFFLLRAIGR
ncbi:hypothetical protein FHT69_001908 [Rhizobium sp. BK008]|nr:hypothetical protein [Rhizobium sp. BK008]